MKPSRRDVLTGLAAAGLSACAMPADPHPARAAVNRPTVGAIRWDAWYAPDSETGRAVENSLGPEKYHFRLPFFAKVEGPDKVVIDGGHQEIMGQEIDFAADAGLDYWAFLGYEPGSPIDKGLALYLSSTKKNRMKFCLMSETARWGSPGHPSPMIERHEALTADPQYQRVLDGRPLYYTGLVDPAQLQSRWGGDAGFRDALDAFRRAVRERSGQNPYIVILDSQAAQAAALATALGADAISSYTHAPRTSRARFAELAKAAHVHWDDEAATGLQVVPTIVTGWDRRPRIDRPMPWEKSQKPGAGAENYYETAQPDEIAQELRDCLTWIDAHPRLAPARTALVYAWDENDEGGWLIPTYPDDHSRMDAVRKMLANG